MNKRTQIFFCLIWTACAYFLSLIDLLNHSQLNAQLDATKNNSFQIAAGTIRHDEGQDAFSVFFLIEDTKTKELMNELRRRGVKVG